MTANRCMLILGGTCLLIDKRSDLLILSFNPVLVASLRHGVEKLGLTQRRYGATTKKYND